MIRVASIDFGFKIGKSFSCKEYLHVLSIFFHTIVGSNVTKETTCRTQIQTTIGSHKQIKCKKITFIFIWIEFSYYWTKTTHTHTLNGVNVHPVTTLQHTFMQIKKFSAAVAAWDNDFIFILFVVVVATFQYHRDTKKN